MTYPTPPTVERRFNSSDSDDVDRLLSRFFQSAMPQSWPSCPRHVSELKTMPAVKKFGILQLFRLPTRVAVAASVAGLLASYLALQSWFPSHTGSQPPRLGNLLPAHGEGMGFNLKPGQFIDKTRSGQAVDVQVEQTPDRKTIILRVQELPAQK